MEWLKQNQHKTLFGQMLLDAKLISEEQLARAIEQQKRTGQRLGDVIAEWNLISQQQVAALLRRQRVLRLTASIATALLGPLHAYASVTSAPIAPITTQSASSSHKQGGLRALSDAELSATVAQGPMEDILGSWFNTMNSKFAYNVSTQSYQDHKLEVLQKPTSGLKVLGDVAKMLNPLLMMFSADISIKDVVYAAGGNVPVINKDGSITLSMPATIGEIRFDNIRVRGNTGGPSFGSIAMRDINMVGTTVTVRPH